jgi:hypothetical protein
VREFGFELMGVFVRGLKRFGQAGFRNCLFVSLVVALNSFDFVCILIVFMPFCVFLGLWVFDFCIQY